MRSPTVRRSVASVALAVLLSACSGGDSIAPAQPSATGTWRAVSALGSVFELTLTESGDGHALSGSGTFTADTINVPLTVEGSHHHPNISFTIHPDGYQDVTFDGHFTSSANMTGSLTGSGFTGETIIFQRQ